MISNFLSTLVDLVWGLPLVIWLVGGGLALSIISIINGQFLWFKIPQALKLLTTPKDPNKPGQVSHFGALCNALSGTVGMGNISGVALAIATGGPGAIFWMWISALVGMSSKFFECSLAVMFRSKDYQNEIQGGHMYIIEKKLPKLKSLAWLFAIFGLLGTLSIFNVNQMAQFAESEFAIPPLVSGIVTAIFVVIILWGGVRRVASWTSIIVPSMCLLYVVLSLVIIVMNLEKVPQIFSLIFSEAFTFKSAWGAAAGLSFSEIMKIGIRRAAFSNEAGLGTAPLAHGNASTDKAYKEGLVAMLGPIIDTLIVCTMTALVILISLDASSIMEHKDQAIIITKLAFEKNLGTFGIIALGVLILFFSFSTVIGMAHYGSKCFNYLFKGKWIFTKHFFIILYALTVVWGSFNSQDDVVNLVDIGLGLMAIPAMLTTLLLSKYVMKEMKADNPQ